MELLLQGEIYLNVCKVQSENNRTYILHPRSFSTAGPLRLANVLSLSNTHQIEKSEDSW